MDKKTLIIGVSAVAAAGVIGAGSLMLASDSDGLRQQDSSPETSQEDKEKIEELVWETWKDTEKYSFCLGDAKIQNEYSDSLLDANGSLNFSSKELLLYDKEAKKLYIITRETSYSYEGQFITPMGDLSTNVPVSEYGSLKEVYAKNEMPIRVDYMNGYIVTHPDTKKNMWVYSKIGEEGEMVGPRNGCTGVFQLGGLSGDDAGGYASIERACDESDISGSYQGTFSFNCSAIDYASAKDLYGATKVAEELQNTKDMSVFEEEGGDPEVENAVSGGERDTLEPESTERPSSDDIQKALKEMQEEMGASQRSE